MSIPTTPSTIGLVDGGQAKVSSRVGTVVVPVEVTDGIRRGVVSLPHGWGHDLPGADLDVAARHAGVNVQPAHRRRRCRRPHRHRRAQRHPRRARPGLTARHSAWCATAYALLLSRRAHRRFRPPPSLRQSPSGGSPSCAASRSTARSARCPLTASGSPASARRTRCASGTSRRCHRNATTHRCGSPGRSRCRRWPGRRTAPPWRSTSVPSWRPSTATSTSSTWPTAELANLTEDGYEGSSFDDAPVGTPVDIVPAWSPDGSQLAFVRSSFGDEPRSTTIMRVDRSGGDPVEVHRLDVDEPFAVWTPMHWLADDTIIYAQTSSDVEEPTNGIWRLPLDGGTPVRLKLGDVDEPGLVVGAARGDYLSVLSLPLVTSVHRSSDDEVLDRRSRWLDACPCSTSIQRPALRCHPTRSPTTLPT